MSVAILHKKYPADALYEIVDGEIVELRSMGKYANRIARLILNILDDYLKSKPIGFTTLEETYILDIVRDLRRRPDVGFCVNAKWKQGDPIEIEGDWEFPPDLAIEVQSPFDTVREFHKKLGEYFQYGVREVWHVLPEQQQVLIYTGPKAIRPLGAEDTLTTDLLPGLSFLVGSIFPPVAR